MSTADFTVATPAPAAAGNALLAEGANQQQAADLRTQSATQIGYNNDVFGNRTMPQLQSSIGAAGQWYGTAAQGQHGALLNAEQDIKKSNYDVDSAMHRQLDDLTRQRMYASVGLIV